MLKKVDHITYAVRPERIKFWTKVHTEIEGGKLITQIDDVDPTGPSSMMLYCIDFSGNFGIALVAGIDRRESSQVSVFVEQHGDHAVQHVAFEAESLEKFLGHLRSFGGRLRGETVIRHDGFGPVKQVFGKGYAPSGDPAADQFPEYLERPRYTNFLVSFLRKLADWIEIFFNKILRRQSQSRITFSQSAGRGFYAQIEDARKRGDREALLDESTMPDDWKIPDPPK